ncbi:hypothetical protein KC340_g94 [Hortaea werneckii]|nr:hypothetical protein KC340_g94 [Hortaea werneckii]
MADTKFLSTLASMLLLLPALTSFDSHNVVGALLGASAGENPLRGKKSRSSPCHLYCPGLHKVHNLS